MNTQIWNPTNADFNVTVNPCLNLNKHDIEPDYDGDISQLGLRRNRLPKALYCKNSGIVTYKVNYTRTPEQRMIFGLFNADTELTVTCDFGAFKCPELIPGEIELIQKALQPTRAVEDREVFESEDWIKFERSCGEKIKSLVESAALQMAAAVPRAPSLGQTFIDFLNLVEKPTGKEEDTESVIPETMLTQRLSKKYADALQNAEISSISSLATVIAHEWSLISDLLYKLVEHRLIAEKHEDAKTTNTGSALFETIRRAIAGAEFKPANGLPDWIGAMRTSTAIASTAPVTIRINDQLQDLVAARTNVAVLACLCLYTFYYEQIVQLDPAVASRFAEVRMTLHRYYLLGNSEEQCDLRLIPDYFYTIQETHIQGLRTYFEKPEFSKIAVACSIISFMKSGHHATTANLDNTLSKLCASIGLTVTRQEAQKYIVPVIYYASHPADVRLTLYVLKLWGLRGKMTSSVLLRLNPAPPGCASFYNVEIFADTLNRSKFFDVTKRLESYNLFKKGMHQLREIAPFAAPYAHYLYGVTKNIPATLREQVSTMFPYVEGYKNIAPNSSLNLSPALLKAGAASANIDFISPLIVEGYFAGLRRVSRTKVENLAERVLLV
jgi:hypothetical protein